MLELQKLYKEDEQQTLNTFWCKFETDKFHS